MREIIIPIKKRQQIHLHTILLWQKRRLSWSNEEQIICRKWSDHSTIWQKNLRKYYSSQGITSYITNHQRHTNKAFKNVYHPSDLTTREPQNQQCRNINTNLQRLNGGWTMHSLSLVPPSTLRPPPLSMKNYLKRPWDIVGTLLAPLVQHAHVWNIRLKRHTRIPFRHQVSGTHETIWHGIMDTTWGTGVVHSNFYKTLHMP